MIDQIEAVREASARRGAASSGYNPPAPTKPAKTINKRETATRTRITKKTTADQTAYGLSKSFPEPSQLTEEEKQFIRLARLAASKKRTLTAQQKQYVEHYKGKRIPAAKKTPK